jgi:hypothetical protein
MHAWGEKENRNTSLPSSASVELSDAPAGTAAPNKNLMRGCKISAHAEAHPLPVDCDADESANEEEEEDVRLAEDDADSEDCNRFPCAAIADMSVCIAEFLTSARTS